MQQTKQHSTVSTAPPVSSDPFRDPPGTMLSTAAVSSDAGRTVEPSASTTDERRRRAEQRTEPSTRGTRKRNAKTTDRARNELDANKKKAKRQGFDGATRLVRPLRAETTRLRRYPEGTGLARMTPSPPTPLNQWTRSRRYRATSAAEHRSFPAANSLPRSQMWRSSASPKGRLATT